jgi:hypothetical protein
MPQLPQLSASLPFVTTQAVPHMLCPVAQLVLQTLLLQTSFVWQVVMQSPQWVASDVTQLPLQSIPDWHLHWLFWQVCPVEQGMPQPPQLVESDVVSTQSVPQAVCPVKQLLPVVPAVPVEPPVVPPAPPEPGLLQAAPKSARPSPTISTRVANTRAVCMPF